MQSTKRTPRKAPQQARSRETVDAIVEAAARIIAKGGVSAVTMREVARVAGVSSGTLYHYFASEEALLAVWEERCLSLSAERFVARLIHLREENARVERFLEEMVVLGVELVHGHMVNVYRGAPTRELASRMAERMAVDEGVIAAITAVLEGVPGREKRFRPANLSIAARLMAKTTIHLSCDLARCPLPQAEHDALVKDLAQMLTRYLVADRPPK